MKMSFAINVRQVIDGDNEVIS